MQEPLLYGYYYRMFWPEAGADGQANKRGIHSCRWTNKAPILIAAAEGRVKQEEGGFLSTTFGDDDDTDAGVTL